MQAVKNQALSAIRLLRWASLMQAQAYEMMEQAVKGTAMDEMPWLLQHINKEVTGSKLEMKKEGGEEEGEQEPVEQVPSLSSDAGEAGPDGA